MQQILIFCLMLSSMCTAVVLPQKYATMATPTRTRLNLNLNLPKANWQNPSELEYLRQQGNYVPTSQRGQPSIDAASPQAALDYVPHTPIAYNYHLLHKDNAVNRKPRLNYAAHDLRNGVPVETTPQYNAATGDLRPSPSPPPITEVTQHFHDIFMHYGGPEELSFGHVERRPELRAKRFEYLGKGNRHRGELIWTDNRGAYGEHRWDMAQGKL